MQRRSFLSLAAPALMVLATPAIVRPGVLMPISTRALQRKVYDHGYTTDDLLIGYMEGGVITLDEPKYYPIINRLAPDLGRSLNVTTVGVDMTPNRIWLVTPTDDTRKHPPIMIMDRKEVEGLGGLLRQLMVPRSLKGPHDSDEPAYRQA